MNYNTTRHIRTRVTFLSLLCIVGVFLTGMHAQESCYEQYLREHNMKILTVEDADDSYEELKKTVLAKQMYGDSYLLMVDTIAQRVMFTKGDGTYIADVHVALVDSTWYMWLSVDPLADKNIAYTPYMYCNGNPIMLIDPDGRDVWDIDVDGNIVNFQKDETRDAFYMGYIDGDGNYHRQMDSHGHERSIQFEYGTIERQKTLDTKSGSYDFYQIRGDKNASQLFEFLSQSTGVEWSLVQTGISGQSGLNFLATSHMTNTEFGMSYAFSQRLYDGYTIRTWMHNHPNNMPYPSGVTSNTQTGHPMGEWGDIGAAKSISEYLSLHGRPIPNFYIYLPGLNNYIQYGLPQNK